MTQIVGRLRQDPSIWASDENALHNACHHRSLDDEMRLSNKALDFANGGPVQCVYCKSPDTKRHDFLRKRVCNKCDKEYEWKDAALGYIDVSNEPSPSRNKAPSQTKTATSSTSSSTSSASDMDFSRYTFGVPAPGFIPTTNPQGIILGYSAPIRNTGRHASVTTIEETWRYFSKDRNSSSHSLSSPIIETDFTKPPWCHDRSKWYDTPSPENRWTWRRLALSRSLWKTLCRLSFKGFIGEYES